MHRLRGALPIPKVPMLVARGAFVVFLIASSLQNLAVPQEFYSSLMQYLCGTILLTLYSVVLTWQT